VRRFVLRAAFGPGAPGCFRFPTFLLRATWVYRSETRARTLEMNGFERVNGIVTGG
jgi:hypothetical protein